MKVKSFTADFETTTDSEDCRVWAWAIATVEKEPEVCYGNSLQGFFDYITENLKNPKIYFHNLKFRWGIHNQLSA